MAKKEEQEERRRILELKREGRRRGGRKSSPVAGSDESEVRDEDGLVVKKGKMRTAQGKPYLPTFTLFLTSPPPGLLPWLPFSIKELWS
jgi:hypothetical protein